MVDNSTAVRYTKYSDSLLWDEILLIALLLTHPFSQAGR